MKKNVGTIDKMIRIAIAITILIMYYTNLISGTTAIIGLSLSIIFILTSLIGFCPLYFPFKISTKKK
jgi:hypothetical protein